MFNTLPRIPHRLKQFLHTILIIINNNSNTTM